MGCTGRGRGPSSAVTLSQPCFWQWRHPQLLAVKSCQGKLREVDREATVVLGQQAHPLAPENFAQKHVVLVPTKMTMRPHNAYQHGFRVIRFWHARRKRSRRLAAGGWAASCFRVRCIRSCLPFCSGCPAARRSGRIPNLIHHTASRDNPATAREANGGPLSVRIACGIPYSRKAASKIAYTLAVSVFSTAWQPERS